MKVKKLLRNLIIYVGAFLAVVTLTAGFKVGAFFIGKASSQNPGDSEDFDGDFKDSALTKVLESMLTLDKANFDLDMSLSGENSSPVKVSSSIFLTMPMQTEVSTYSIEALSQDTLKVALKGEVEFNGQQVHYEINYLNGFIYATLGDAQFKIETDNMMGDLNTILNFALLKKFGVNITLPDLSQFTFGPELLSMLANQLTETDTEDGKQIKFNLLGYGWAEILTDKDYNLQSISLSDINFNGTKLSVSLDADLSPLPQEIVEPDNKEDLTDLSGLTKFLQVVDTLAEKGYVSGQASLKVMDKVLQSDYYINFEDFNNLKIYFKTRFFNNDFVLVFQNHNAYISYADCKYCFASPFDFNEIIDAVNFYAKKLGIEIPQEEIDSIMDIVNVKDLNQILQTISNLKVDETGLNYKYNGLELNLSIIDGEFDKITAHFKDVLNLNIDLAGNVQMPVINTSEYKNMLDEDLFKLLNKQIIQNKNLALKGNIQVDGTSLEVVLKADFSDENKLQLILNVYNRKVELTVLDKTIYLEVDGILKAKGSLDEIFEFVKSLNLFEIENKNFDINNVLQMIVNAFDNQNVILKLLKEDENVTAFEIIDPRVHCVLQAIEYEDFTYTESGTYQNLLDLGKLSKTLFENISSKPLAFNISANIKGYALQGKLQYVNGKLSAIISTQVLEKDLTVEIDDKLLYINFDGLKIKCSVDDLKDLSEFLKDSTNFNLDQVMNLFNLDLDQILNNSYISYTDKLLNITLDDLFISINAETVSATLEHSDFSGELTLGQTFTLTSKQGYNDFTQLKDLFKATITTLKDKAISGEVDVVLKLFNADNDLHITYAVELKDNKLVGTLHTTFNGLSVSAYIDGEEIYLDISNLKVKFTLDQLPDIISYINHTFKTEIPSELADMFSVDKLKDIHFDIIKNITSQSNKTSVELTNGLNIVINFNAEINSVEFWQGSSHATLTCTKSEGVSLNIDTTEFRDYTILTDLIDTVLNLTKSKQFDISTNIYKYQNNEFVKSYNADVVLDLNSGLNAYLNILGLSEQITINYENKVMYLCYGGDKGLKLSIQENAIQEILSICFSALKIDTSAIPFLNDFLQKDNIDTSNLESILPKIELSNPLQYLQYIQSFNLSENSLQVVLKAEKLGEYAKDKDISIELFFESNKITKLTINNLYLNQNDEFVNVSVNLNPFTKISSVQNKDRYIDISGSKDLLRAFVNTSNLNNWHIVGKVKLDLKLGSLSINAVELNVDVKVALDEDKKPLIAMEFSSYPLIGLVNNKNTNGVGAIGFAERYRTISIFYKSGEIYLKTNDEKYGAYKELTRTTKVTSTYLFNNLSYYMQYLFGFTDSIQSKIDEAIQKSQSYEGDTDYGNIIEEYSQSGNSHTIKLNLAEITHNSDIGSLSLILTTINNESTNNKDFLYRIDLDLEILNSMIILKTNSQNSAEGLYLTDIGSAVDMSSLDEIENLYKENGFALDGEYQKEGTKAWKKDNLGSSEITFVSQDEQLSTISGEVASNISFPQMNNFVEDDGKIWQEFRFDGWFYDTDFTNPFTSTTFPRYNTTLFAKWVAVETRVHATISFVTNQENLTVDSLNGFVGENITLPTCQNIVLQINENTSILKTFLGWFTESGELYTSSKFEAASQVLYARWSEKETKVYSVTVISNQNTVYSNKLENGTFFDFTNIDDYKLDTLVYTSSNFEESTLTDNFVVTSNITWYLRNKFKVTVKYDIKGYDSEEKLKEYELYEGSSLTLDTYQDFSQEYADYTSEFEFMGYSLNSQIITDSVVLTPNGDCTYEAVWKETQWCMVKFDVVWARPSGWVKDGTKKSMSGVSNTNGTNQIRVERNSTLNFADYVATATYNYKITVFARDYDFKTVAWQDTAENVNVGSYRGATSMVITSNCTLKPVWKAQ